MKLDNLRPPTLTEKPLSLVGIRQDRSHDAIIYLRALPCGILPEGTVKKIPDHSNSLAIESEQTKYWLRVVICQPKDPKNTPIRDIIQLIASISPLKPANVTEGAQNKSFNSLEQ